MDDAPVWSLDALVPLTRHQDAEVGAWALGRIAALGGPAALDALCAAPLGDGRRELAIIRGIARCTEGPLSLEVAQRLRSLADGTEGDDAIELLAERGDSATLDLLDARCREHDDAVDWLAFAKAAPERCRAVLAARGYLADPAQAHRGVLCALALCLPRDAFGSLLERFIHPREQDYGASFGWYLLERCGAEAGPWPDTNAHRRGKEFVEAVLAEVMAARADSDRALAGRWDTVDALHAVGDAFVRHRWTEVIAWSRARVELLRRGDEEAALLARLTTERLSQVRKPDDDCALLAFALALAATGHAMEVVRPWERCALDAQVGRAFACPAHASRHRTSTLRARWNALSPAHPDRAVIEGALARVLASPTPELRERALLFAAALPGLTLPDEVLTTTADEGEEIADLRVRCLSAHPASLRRIAARTLGAPGARGAHDVALALSDVNRRWASTMLLDAWSRARTQRIAADSILTALGDLADPAHLPALLDNYVLRDATFIEALCHTAQVAGLDRYLPRRGGALTAPEGGSEQRRTDFAAELRCNRCHADFTQRATGATVHGDLDDARKNHWDGVRFHDIIVCPHCAAEDDYTLTDGTRLYVFLAADMHGDGLVFVGGASDEFERRASERLRNKRAHAEARPSDPAAWRDLAATCARLDRYDEAAAALERALVLQPKDVDGAWLRLHSLVRVGADEAAIDGARVALLGAIAKPIGPKVHLAASIELVVAWLRERLGDGRSLEATWAEDLGNRTVTDRVDLRRVTRWSRLGDFMRDVALRSLTLTAAPATEAGPLERLLEGSARLEEALRPTSLEASRAAARHILKEMAPVARVGRNDPCPCGSGKKYKKCCIDKP